MNHFINALGIDDSVMYILASQCIGFARHPGGNTIIQLASGTGLISKTPPETLEKRLNKYYDELIDYMNKNKNGHENRD